MLSVICLLEYALSMDAVSKSEKNVVPATTTLLPFSSFSAAKEYTLPVSTGILSFCESESNVSVVSWPLTNQSTFSSFPSFLRITEHPLYAL